MSYNNYWGSGSGLGQQGSSSNQPQRYPPPSGRQQPASLNQSSYYTQMQAQTNPYSSYPAVAGYDTYGWGSSSGSGSGSGTSASAYASAAAAYAAASQAQQSYQAHYDAGGYLGRVRPPYQETTYPPVYGYHQSAPFQPAAPRNVPPAPRTVPSAPRSGIPALRSGPPMNDLPSRGPGGPSRRGRGAGPRNIGPAFNNYGPPAPYMSSSDSRPPAPYMSSSDSRQPAPYMRGGRGRGQTAPRFRNSRAPRQDQPLLQQFFCEPCKITCGGEITYREHLNGTKHKKKEQMMRTKSEVPIFAKTKTTYRCDICDCACTGRDTYETHAKGARHQRTLALLTKLNKPVPDGPTIIDPIVGEAIKSVVSDEGVNMSKGEIKTDDSNNKNGIANGNVVIINEDSKMPIRQISEEVQLEIVGREFIEKQTESVSGKVTNIVCKLCNCAFTDPNAEDHHLKGRRHRTQYKMKVDPQIEAEVVPMVLSRKNRKLHGKSRQPIFNPNEFKIVEPMNFMPAPKKSLSVDDMYVMEKDSELAATVEDMDENARIVTLVEQALQSVSNVLYQLAVAENGDVPAPIENNEAVVDAPEPTAAPAAEPDAPSTVAPTVLPPSDNPRVLQGAIRVGDVTKFLLRKNDEKKVVDLVVLTSKIPTYSFVSTVHEKLTKAIEDADFLSKIKDGDKFTVEEDPEKVRLFMKEENSGINVRMTFTCYLVREAIIAETNGESITVEKEKLADPLPTDSCLEALANLRRCKWYQERCTQLSACVPVIRVMRYIREQNPEWNSLSEYLVELLVEKAMRTAGFPLSPGDGLRRVFEMLSGGFLISGQPGLSDPCEVDKSDILSKISMDDRLKITTVAQKILRLIAMNQLYRVLGVEKREEEKEIVAAPVNENGTLTPTSENERKRRLEDRQDDSEGESAAKKDKSEDSAQGPEATLEAEPHTQSPIVDLKPEVETNEVPLVKQETTTVDVKTEAIDHAVAAMDFGQIKTEIPEQVSVDRAPGVE